MLENFPQILLGYLFIPLPALLYSKETILGSSIIMFYYLLYIYMCIYEPFIAQIVNLFNLILADMAQRSKLEHGLHPQVVEVEARRRSSRRGTR